MRLEDHFERSGNWLFRWRSYLPLFFFVLVFAGLRGFRYPNDSAALNLAWCTLCLVIGLAGLAIRGFTVGHAAPGTSGRNTRTQVAEDLNTTGIYSVVRHPLYLGNYLMWIAVALVPRAWWVPAVVSLIFWIYYERIMFAEERFLQRKFGAAFDEWAARTPAFFPAFSRWVPAELPFSIRLALRGEYSGMLGLVVAITAVMLVGNRIAAGAWSLDPRWQVLLGVAVILYIVLRYLRKRTRVLRGGRD